MSQAIKGPGRPKKYLLEDGTRVPGSTTVIGRFKDAGGLVHWAWKLGTEGKDYREERDKAADAGSLAHDMIEYDIHGMDFELDPEFPSVPDGVLEKARNSLKAFQRWAAASHVRITHTEVPLVSEKHGFGGTLDAVGFVGSDWCMIDWKTSNGVYGDYLTQLASYVLLWEENYPDDHITGGHLLRFDKKTSAFTHHYWPRACLVEAEELFLCLLRAYKLTKVVSGYVK